jgi:hypothetical protein
VDAATADFVIAAQSSILCISAWNTHEAKVRLEYWSDQPPALLDWDRQRTQSLRRSKGPAQVVSLTGRVACELDVDVDEGEVLQARLAARGGNSLVQAMLAETASPPAIEEWLVQLWPGPTALSAPAKTTTTP